MHGAIRYAIVYLLKIIAKDSNVPLEQEGKPDVKFSGYAEYWKLGEKQTVSNPIQGLGYVGSNSQRLQVPISSLTLKVCTLGYKIIHESVRS